MTFLRLSGWRVAMVFASTAALVTLIYLLRVRRRRMLVPFGPLWDEVLASERRGNPLRRLRRLLSLLLQVAAVGLVAVALGEPCFGSRTGERRLVIVLDASASMAARAGGRGPSRFEEARSLARRIVEDLREGERAGLLRVLTPKPRRPDPEEVRRNPRSRSARLRGAEKLLLSGLAQPQGGDR